MAAFNVRILSQVQYDSLLASVIEAFEGNSPSVYLDTKGIPTIGIGWNLQSTSHTKDFLEEVLGISDDPSIQFKTGHTYASLLSELSALTGRTYSSGGTVDSVTAVKGVRDS